MCVSKHRVCRFSMCVCRCELNLEGSLDFGVVVLDSKTDSELLLSNTGKRSGAWEAVVPAGLPLKLTPSSGVIGAGETVAVTARFMSRELGSFSGTLEIRASRREGFGENDHGSDDDGTDAAASSGGGIRRRGFPSRVLQVTSTVVSQGFELFKVGTDEALHKINFGKVHYGSTSEASAEIYNAGPVPLPFQMRLVHETDHDGDSDGDDDSDGIGDGKPKKGFLMLAMKKRIDTWKKLSKDHTVSVEPSSGSVPAYGRTRLTFFFKPQKEPHSKGFSSTMAPLSEENEFYSFVGLVSAKGIKQKMKLPLQGRGVRARLKISPNIIDFGDVKVNSYADVPLTLRNESEDLPITFSFPHSHALHVSSAMGCIQPSSANVVVATYVPKTLGRFKETLSVSLMTWTSSSSKRRQRKVGEALLHVTGFSSAIDTERAHRVGGIDKLEHDFARERRFVVPTADDGQSLIAAMPPKTKWVRPKLWETEHALRTLTKSSRACGATSGAGAMAMSLLQHRQRQDHRELYASFIQHERERRGRIASQPRSVDDPLNLGLALRSGLVEPTLSLPTEVSPPLVLAPVGKMKQSLIRPRNRPAFDREEEEFGVPTFPAKPANVTQRSSIMQPLSPDEIPKISAGPKLITFGCVSAYSSSKRVFGVTNGLARHIVVSLLTDAHDELKDSMQSTQVIPPGATAGFPIILRVSHMQTISKTVNYTINGASLFSFSVAAEVVPVSLDISTTTLGFAFDMHNAENFVEETLIIRNPGAQPAEYTWEGKSGTTFSVSPQHGVVRGKSSEEVRFRYKPPPGLPSSSSSSSAQAAGSGSNEAVFTLRVVGGSGDDKSVTCTGEPPEGKCAFRDRLVDFKTVSLGVVQKTGVALRNVGNKDTVFSVDEPSSGMLSVSPMSGPIAAGTTQTLEIMLDPNMVGALESKLIVTIRGGKTLSVPVRASVIVPQVRFVEEQFDFESVYMGGMARRVCTAANDSDIPVTLEVDLASSEHKGSFFLDISRDQWSTDDYDEVPLSGSGVYTICIAPRHELSFNIVFKPDCVTTYDFELPVRVVGLPKAEATSADAALSRRVVARALRPRMLINNPTVSFGSKIVLRERVKKIPYSTELAMRNNDDSDFVWRLGPLQYESDATMRGSFDVEPVSGTLGPGEVVHVKVTFLPRDSVQYRASVPVHLDGKEESDYVIELVGAGSHPKIVCLEREVMLPAVPLGVTSCASFYLLNQGYDNLDLQYKLPADSANIPLELSFPEGQMIGIAKDRLRVDVSFKSNKAMSFTAQVVFLDEDGNRFPVQVSGVTDNSMLSTYAFVRANKERIGAALDSVQPGAAPRMLAEPAEGEPYAMPPPPTEADETGIDNIVRFFNASTMMGPFNNIVEAIVSSRGAVFIELLEFYSGKSVPGKIGSRMTASGGAKKEQTEQLLAQYEKLLIFMKGHGALLNCLKPEYLVGVDDLRRIVSTKTQRAADEFELQSLEPWRRLEDSFARVSAWAWGMMLQQLVKTTILCRITPRQYAELPMGADAESAKADTSLSASNVYSVHESILLKWMSHHLSKVFPRLAHRVTNFDEHLRSGLVIFSLLAAHWPGLKTLYSSLRKPAAGARVSAADASVNASIILRAMKMLELPFPLTESQLVSPDAREMLIFVLYLYQTLPQLAPQMNIVFQGVLGSRIAREVELTNPTNSTVVYSARLEGSSEFSVPFKSVSIEPRSSAKIQIECEPRMSRPSEGHLILQSSREGGVYASTNVFKLKCDVQQDMPLLDVHVSGAVYELVTQDIEVKNPYPAECDFAVTVIQGEALTLATDAAGAATGGADDRTSARGGRGILSTLTAAGNRHKATERRGGGAAKSAEKSGNDDGSNGGGRFKYPDAFGCDRRTMVIRKGDVSRLTLFFLPFSLGSHCCHIRFSSSEYGHFVYRVSGDAALPSPLAVHKFAVEPTGATSKDISISVQNAALESAKRLFLDRHPLSRVAEQAELARASMPTVPVKYRVDYVSSYVSLPTDVLLHAGSSNARAPKRVEASAAAAASSTSAADASGVGGSGGAGGVVGGGGKTTTSSSNNVASKTEEAEADAGFNLLPVTIEPRGAGVYPCRVVLSSQCDVRVLDLEFSAASGSHTAELDFVCTASQEIVQDIPLVNSSDKSLAVRATIVGDGFSGPRELAVDPFTTVNYALTFAPAVVGAYEGELQLHIVTTGESSTYRLKGIADDPAAEAHVAVVMQARDTKTASVSVPNPTGADVTYAVYSDLPFIYGNGSLKVKKDATVNFELGLRPPKSGLYRGSVTFASPSGQYVWFTVEVDVSSPASLDTIDVRSEVRRAKEISIELTNPLDTDVTFDVDVDGDGLNGAESISLRANETGSYELLYCPLVPGETEGRLRFVSDTVGEFEYELRLTAEEVEPLPLEEVHCELGDSTVREITLTNPTGQVLTLSTESDHPAGFMLFPETFTLGAFETGTVSMRYTPSVLEVSESALLTVHVVASGAIAWQFAAHGRGTPPSRVESVSISAPVGETGNGVVTFRNPFPSTVGVSLHLEGDAAGVFDIGMLRRGGEVQVEPLGTLTVPVVFSPRRMEESGAILHINADNLSWKYQIMGRAETLGGPPISLATRSRQELDEHVDVRLAGMTADERVSVSEFYVEVSAAEEAARNALSVSPLRILTDGDDMMIRLRVRFTPLRVMSSRADVVVCRGTGGASGRWRRELRLDAAESETEGVVDVSAQVGEIGTAVVRVHSTSSSSAAFRAYFSPESAMELDVTPAQGIMPGVGDGAPPLELNVTYAPVEYGRAAAGLLIVETDEMQRSFQVNGVRPEYTPPRGVSRLEMSPSVEVMRRLTNPRPAKNFVRANIMMANASVQQR